MSIQIGSVSSGTMRVESLVHRFLDVLADEGVEITDELPAWIDGEFADQDEASDYLGMLFDELNHIAPPFVYFGSHEGDGSDYGFWLDRDSMNEDPSVVHLRGHGDEKFLHLTFPNGDERLFELKEVWG